MSRERPVSGSWGLLRVKRAWVPGWLWRVFCVGNLATFTPWKEMLTAPASEEKQDPASGGKL